MGSNDPGDALKAGDVFDADENKTKKYAVGASETLQKSTKDGVDLSFLTKLVNSKVDVEIPVEKIVNSKDDELFNLNTEFTATLEKANPLVEGDTSEIRTGSVTLHKNDQELIHSILMKRFLKKMIYAVCLMILKQRP